MELVNSDFLHKYGLLLPALEVNGMALTQKTASTKEYCQLSFQSLFYTAETPAPFSWRATSTIERTSYVIEPLVQHAIYVIIGH